jgi:hypothetical protein
VSRFEHGESLADTGAHADKQLHPTATSLHTLFLDGSQKQIRIGLRHLSHGMDRRSSPDFYKSACRSGRGFGMNQVQNGGSSSGTIVSLGGIAGIGCSLDWICAMHSFNFESKSSFEPSNAT